MMRVWTIVLLLGAALLVAGGFSSLAATAASAADVKVSEGELTLPTYVWEEDINPRFWALEGGTRLSTMGQGSVTYPYVMQDHLLRNKINVRYRALFLENEYLKVTCLPELGGRLHSVLDKTQNKEMFHLNGVIKPSMIAMRGAWISGGVEWNTGPHGHTVTILAPVNAVTGTNDDGSAYLDISNVEQIFRTRWTVRVTLRPGRAFLEERIRLFNPTGGMHPYYFWNCTAFPNKPGTRFIYPMTLGTDHNAREFFRWPIHEGRDLSWLKNYPIYTSIFAVQCTHDFFGAYETGANRGIVQVADHRLLGGKKAWTWGEWQFGKVAQRNLTDDADGGPYIEVQTGPLPTQSDYGMLGPRDQVAWTEWWYPVHGLGDGFEYATRDLAVQTARREGKLELRMIATAKFSKAVCDFASDGKPLGRQELKLSPAEPAVVVLPEAGDKPVEVTVSNSRGQLLAKFTTPLPIPKVDPPDPKKFQEKPEEQMSVEELYLKGRKADRETDRLRARAFYEKALARDAGHVASLRSLAVLDYEAALYGRALDRLAKALDRDGDDGLAWFVRGECWLRLNDPARAADCGYHAVRCSGTESIGYDLVGRAKAKAGDKAGAVAALRAAVRANADNTVAVDRLILALRASGNHDAATTLVRQRLTQDATALVPRAVDALRNDSATSAFARELHMQIGDRDFETLEASVAFVDAGLPQDAIKLLRAVCIDTPAANDVRFLPLYHVAWYTKLGGDAVGAKQWLARAASTHTLGSFASRPEELEILQYAVRENPEDGQACTQLGCLLANFGRMDEAAKAWQEAVRRDAAQSVAWRNLGLVAATKNDLAAAESCYKKAIAARRDDQTLYRDLAEILIAAKRRPEAIRVLEAMPVANVRRAEIVVMLAENYLAENRFDDCVKLWESLPYFVAWEGQDVTWRLFNRAHIERGKKRLETGNAQAALADFDAALTYPANLNVGRSNKPEEAPAHYWRGKALAALRRAADAKKAWQAGAEGADVPGAQNEFRQKCRDALAALAAPAAPAAPASPTVPSAAPAPKPTPPAPKAEPAPKTEAPAKPAKS